MPTYGFPKACRLLSPNDFQPVFQQPDIRVGCQQLLILAKHSANRHRLGLVVAKKQIRLANRRNRVKRLLRESFRHYQFKYCADIVVLVRHGANDMDNKQLFVLLEKQWQRVDKKLAKLAAAV